MPDSLLAVAARTDIRGKIGLFVYSGAAVFRLSLIGRRVIAAGYFNGSVGLAASGQCQPGLSLLKTDS
jgi:hypothetical protein